MKRLFFVSFLLLSLRLLAQSDIRINEYESSREVKITLNSLHSNVLPVSKGLCATHVRLGYMASGLFERHPGISYAKDYDPFLRREGWTDLSNSIESDLMKTPSGCTVVYDAIDPKNDRNGHIGHIEVRTKRNKANGFISDYYSTKPRTGLTCIKKGPIKRKLKTFMARSRSPFYKANSKVKVYINVTTCAQYSSLGAFESDEFLNRRVTGVFCKFNDESYE